LAANDSSGGRYEAGRTILDISSIARWRGPAVGILRVQEALARFALSHRPDILLAVYDKTDGCFRAVNPRWASHIVGWSGAVGRRHGRIVSLLPTPYTLVDALERVRPAARGATLSRAIKALHWFALSARRRRRRGIVPYAIAVGAPLLLGPRDTVIATGSDWNWLDAAKIVALKTKLGFRYIAMCYDIITFDFPHYFPPEHVADFRRYWEQIFPAADRVLVNSQAVARDVTAYCRRNGLHVATPCVVPLGFEPTLRGVTAPLPANLEAGRYILFVSTIEPRKGHSMLIRAWERLSAANVPQSERFKLAFVGRRGWGVDAALNRIDDQDFCGGTVVHLAGIDDGTLAALYGAAAFCVYPSVYEGFGLPVIEALSLGKAVIASTGGALPETVGRFSPCLDPNDEDAWFETLKTWIQHPEIRAQYEAVIRAEFSWPTWEQAAPRIVDALPPDPYQTSSALAQSTNA
jgi:glycosyltransferase involved in cell wall biosynthesis